MANNASWIKLDSVINDYIDESEQSIHKYSKLFNLAFRGMDDMGIDFFYQVKSVILPINPNKTVTLPNDYLNWAKVGVLNSRGEVQLLKYNDKLANYADLNPNRLTNISNNDLIENLYSVSSPNFYNYWDGYGYFSLFGSGYYGGTFKIDNANGVIILEPNFVFDSIVLEYVGSPKEGEEYFIPQIFREAMIAWLSYMDIRSMPRSRKGDLGDKDARRKEYYNSRRVAGLRFKPFVLEEHRILNQENSRSVVKS